MLLKKLYLESPNLQGTTDAEVNYTTSKGDFQILYLVGNHIDLTPYVLAAPMNPFHKAIVNLYQSGLAALSGKEEV